MKDSGGKAIKVTPEELIFDQVSINQPQVQQLTLKNNLSAPVEIVMLIFNLNPISSRHQNHLIKREQILNPKAFPAKTTKQKETIFIKSDFFDQKVNVTLIPSTSTTTPRDSSLQNSLKGTRNLQVSQVSLGHRFRNDSQKRDSSPFDLEKELENKSQIINDLNTQLQKQQLETSNAYAMLKEEQLRRRDLEERLDQGETNPNDDEYLNEVKRLLREREPNLESLMEISLKKERDQQERKDAKILEILKMKDQQIEELQQRCVAQESEYGKLAQMYQDAKRKIRQMEEHEETLRSNQLSFQNQLEQSRSKLLQFENGKEYQKMIELEERLKEAQSFIEKLESENYHTQLKLEEKTQIEAYCEEALERYKEQLQEKENHLLQVMREFEREKEQRIREEEHSKSLMQQITQIHKESINDKQFQKSYSDLMNNYTKLQDEKSEYIAHIQDLKTESRVQEDKLRILFERLSQIRGVGAYSITNYQSLGEKPLLDKIENRIEDIARLVKEMEDDNIEMNNKNKKLSEIVAQREQELQQVIEENEDISQQLKKSTRNISKGAQTAIELEDMEVFDQVRDKCGDLEDFNDQLKNQLQDYERKLKVLQKDLDGKNQEIQFLTRGSLGQGTLRGNKGMGSVTASSDVSQIHMSAIGCGDYNDEAISRLNAKITQMKMNEDKLLEEISVLRQQVSIDTNQASQLKSNSIMQFGQASKSTIANVEERIGEYEGIILEQREQLIKVEEENNNLRRQLKETQSQATQQSEQLNLRIKNLQELNNKHEQFYTTNAQTQSMQQSDYFTYSQHSGKSTAVETERMRQYAQQLELNSMTLKHQNEEFKTMNAHLTTELNIVKDELKRNEQQIIRMKQELKLGKVGLGMGDSFMQEKDSKIATKVIEQRKKIKFLEGLLVRAKQDFDKLKSGTTTKPQQFGGGSNTGQYSQRVEELVKQNEKLRREHQQALMIVVDLQEEYSSKLMILNEKNEQVRQKLIKENQNLFKKVEVQQTQIAYMEKKEMRLFGQLEEAKHLQQQESQEKEARTKELEELLFKKEETINDLEREIKMKDKSLQERQEQISVLIGTLENEHSQDELKQRVLNLSAELCSIKAIESQQLRKINELTHQLKKTELSSNKSSKIMDQEKLRNKELQQLLKKIETENYSLEKKLQDQMMQIDEKDREISELKYKNERQEFQIQVKEENLQQTRDQLKRAESMFKEEVGRLRKEFFANVNKDYDHKMQAELNKATSFKTAVQSLHLVISDYLNTKLPQQEEKSIIQEFEKALVVASQNIEKIQNELDRSNYIVSKFTQDLKFSALSKILILRQEQQQIQIQKMQILQNQREEERANYIKSQENSFKQILKQQDLRIQYLEKENSEVNIEISELKETVRTLNSQKEELEQSLILFEQEIENKKLSMERRAEIKVDERFKSKHEAIKTYFDSNITRLLLNTQQRSDEKMIELGREIVALKLNMQKLQDIIVAEQAQCQAIELNLAHYKELKNTQEQKIRELQLKNHQLLGKLQKQELTVKVEIERRKQELISLEKEMIKQKDIVEAKTRENIILQEQVQKYDYQNKGQQKTFQLEEQVAIKDTQIQQNMAVIHQLQDSLLELRAQQITELDDLRTQYDMELTEAKRQLYKEREQLEKRYMPGYAPGDIMEENGELQRRITELKQALERVMQENVIVRKKLENEKSQKEGQRSEIEGYKQALLELESTMIEMTNLNQNQQQMSQVRERSSSKNRVTNEERKKDKKSLRIKNKQQSLHFNKDSYPEESQSRIQQYDSSSLNVSAFTSVNMIPTNQRASTSITHYSNATNAQLPSAKQFIINPPILVKALIQSKMAELSLKKKYEELCQNEIENRQNNKNILVKELEYKKRKESQDEITDYQQRIIKIEIENEDLKLQRVHDQVQQYKNHDLDNKYQLQNLDYPLQDYSTMIEALISLISYIANIEVNRDTQVDQQVLNIEEAQRLVIRALSHKILTQEGQIQDIQFIPSEQNDRKLWYLELLEQQVNASEQVVHQLQTFIKKLQIDIQGNLQSAAQIKAASMDLAQNTKKTSEEVKTLRYMIGLIKHDLNNNMKPQLEKANQPIGQKTINPFAETQNRMSQTQLEQLMQNNDQLKNQLTITEKVKKTLEQEIVNIKIVHAQELQSLNQQLSSALDQRNSLLSTNEELHNKVQLLQTKLDNLKQEIHNLSQENTQNQTFLQEKEKEKQILAQNKTATSKHLQKLQQDMQEWRKQTDENMKIKDKQINELTNQVSQLQSEKDKLKSENQMLRRVDKERKQSETGDLKKLEAEKKELMDKLQKEIEERKMEIEFWVTERATMRQMIEQLENEKLDGALMAVSKDLPSSVDEKVKNMKKKSMKRIKEKELEIKTKDKQVLELKDELHKVKQQTTQLDQKLREHILKQAEAEEKSRYYQQKVKELELERDLVLAERNNAISAQDLTAQHIQSELNSLRECFAKLKIERDNLLSDIENTQLREREWRQTVDQLNEEMQLMQDQINVKDKEQNESIRTLDSKSHALIQDVKFLKNENERLKLKLREVDEQTLTYEQKLHSEEMKHQELQYKLEASQRRESEYKAEIRRQEEKVHDIEGQMISLEGVKMREIDGMNNKLEELKESNTQIIALYENQLQELRSRFAIEKKKTEQQIEQMFTVAQREAVIKSLKKELSLAKTSLSKVKAKNKELKANVANQENQQTSNQAKIYARGNLKSKHSFVARNEQEDNLDKQVIKLSQLLIAETDGKPMSILEKLQKSNQSMLKCYELQAEVEKLSNHIMLLEQNQEQIENAKFELEKQIEGLQKSQLKESKTQKQNQAQSEITKQLKQEVKQLQQEIETMKQEWVSPQDSRTLQERIKEYLAQIKSLKDEVQRKKEVISQMKSQKEQTESEANQIIADMEGLKDDNQKLQKLIKENNKNIAMAKDLKIQNDYLKVQEKKYKEEIVMISEKIKQAKVEIQRKDQIIKDYKDKLDYIQDEVNNTKERNTEIEKLKEQNKKLRIDSEIKENQVKQLKNKLEYIEGELDNHKQLSVSNIQSTQNNQQQLESQVKLTKTKIKKYEAYLKKSLEALRKIGKELTQQSTKAKKQQHFSSKHSSSVDNNPMKISEFDKEMYKDSVGILGMSIDEFEDFMNPNQSISGGIGSKQQSKEDLNFIAKLEKAVDIPETLNQDLEQICNYCVKLINELNPDVKFN